MKNFCCHCVRKWRVLANLVTFHYCQHSQVCRYCSYNIAGKIWQGELKFDESGKLSVIHQIKPSKLAFLQVITFWLIIYVFICQMLGNSKCAILFSHQISHYTVSNDFNIIKNTYLICIHLIF